MNRDALTSSILAAHPTGCKLRSLVRKLDPVLGAKLPKRDFAEKLYLHIYGKRGTCKQCGEPAVFRSFYKGYAPFCSRICSVVYHEPNTGRPQRDSLQELSKLFIRRLPVENLYSRARGSRVWAKITDHAEKFHVPPAQILYHMYVTPEVPVCPNCGDQTRFMGIAKGYKTYCCVDCSNTGMSWDRRNEKFRATCQERYGVNHYMQNSDIYSRASKAMKRTMHVRIGKRQFLYQGYELYMLYYLVAKYGTNAIHTGIDCCNPIWYKYGGTKHRYYPDMRVDETIYEVKSTRTLGVGNERLFNRVVAKAEAVRAAGYAFKCAVFREDGRLLLLSSLQRPYEYYVRKLGR